MREPDHCLRFRESTIEFLIQAIHFAAHCFIELGDGLSDQMYVVFESFRRDVEVTSILGREPLRGLLKQPARLRLGDFQQLLQLVVGHEFILQPSRGGPT